MNSFPTISLLTLEKPIFKHENSDQINCLEIIEENILLISSFKFLYFLDLFSLKILKKIQCHDSNITSSKFVSPNTIITTGFDGYVKKFEYSIETKSNLITLKKVFEIQLECIILNSICSSNEDVIIIQTREKNNANNYYFINFHFGSVNEMEKDLSNAFAEGVLHKKLFILTTNGRVFSYSLINFEKEIFTQEYFTDVVSILEISQNEILLGKSKGEIIVMNSQTKERSFQINLSLSSPIKKILKSEDIILMISNEGIDMFPFNSPLRFYKGKARVTGLIQSKKSSKVYISTFKGEIFENRLINKIAYQIYFIEKMIGKSVPWNVIRSLIKLLI